MNNVKAAFAFAILALILTLSPAYAIPTLLPIRGVMPTDAFTSLSVSGFNRTSPNNFILVLINGVQKSWSSSGDGGDTLRGLYSANNDLFQLKIPAFYEGATVTVIVKDLTGSSISGSYRVQSAESCNAQVINPNRLDLAKGLLNEWGAARPHYYAWSLNGLNANYFYNLEDTLINYLRLSRQCKNWDRVEEIADIINVAPPPNSVDGSFWSTFKVAHSASSTCENEATPGGDCLRENPLETTHWLYLLSYMASTIAEMPQSVRAEHPGIQKFLDKYSWVIIKNLKRVVFQTPQRVLNVVPEQVGFGVGSPPWSAYRNPLTLKLEGSPSNATLYNHEDYIKAKLNSTLCPIGSLGAPPSYCDMFYHWDFYIWAAILETLEAKRLGLQEISPELNVLFDPAKHPGQTLEQALRNHVENLIKVFEQRTIPTKVTDPSGVISGEINSLSFDAGKIKDHITWDYASCKEDVQSLPIKKTGSADIIPIPASCSPSMGSIPDAQLDLGHFESLISSLEATKRFFDQTGRTFQLSSQGRTISLSVADTQLRLANQILYGAGVPKKEGDLQLFQNSLDGHSGWINMSSGDPDDEIGPKMNTRWISTGGYAAWGNTALNNSLVDAMRRCFLKTPSPTSPDYIPCSYYTWSIPSSSDNLKKVMSYASLLDVAPATAAPTPTPTLTPTPEPTETSRCNIDDLACLGCTVTDIQSPIKQFEKSTKSLRNLIEKEIAFIIRSHRKARSIALSIQRSVRREFTAARAIRSFDISILQCSNTIQCKTYDSTTHLSQFEQRITNLASYGLRIARLERTLGFLKIKTKKYSKRISMERIQGLSATRHIPPSKSICFQ